MSNDIKQLVKTLDKALRPVWDQADAAVKYASICAMEQLQSALSAPPAQPQVSEPIVPLPLADAQHLLSWMDAVFGNEDGDDWFDSDAGSVADGLESAVERFKRANPALAQPAAHREDAAQTDADRAATQRFAIFNTLVSHCGQSLTPDRVDQITDELMSEIRSGGTSWAFGKATGSAAT